MNESDARNAFLVRSFETASPPSANWSEQDRDWATRAAAEIEGENASHAAFVAQRARLAVERLRKREARIGRGLDALCWRPWLVWLLAAVAFGLGLASDAIGAGQRINVLAPPLLALIVWNLLVYALSAGRSIASAAGRRPTGRISGWLSRWLARVAGFAATGRRRSAATDSRDDERAVGARILASFARDWSKAAAELNGRRLSRLLHLAAIGFAIGALAGLYLRGLAFEYRAGWESTFLDASSLRALLHAVLGPAAALTGIPLPDEARLEAMRFPASNGEQAGPWIHLYAVTIALVVVLPRAALALFDFVRERRLAREFPIALEDGYFAALGRAHRREAAPVRVLPYNFAPPAVAKPALEALLGPVIGTGLALELLPSTAYGDEEDAGVALSGSEPLALAVVLLASTATPEAETHGRFIESAAAALPPGTPLLVLVDESAFLARFGDDPTATRRREERRQAWTRWLAENEREAVFVELTGAGTASAESALRKALAHARASRRHP